MLAQSPKFKLKYRIVSSSKKQTFQLEYWVQEASTYIEGQGTIIVLNLVNESQVLSCLVSVYSDFAHAYISQVCQEEMF